MRVTTTETDRQVRRRRRWRRLGWFVLLYAAGLLVMLVVAYVLRSLLLPA